MSHLPKMYRPNGCTDKRMSKIWPIASKIEFLWNDVIDRHGLNEMSLDELKEKNMQYGPDKHRKSQIWHQKFCQGEKSMEERRCDMCGRTEKEIAAGRTGEYSRLELSQLVRPVTFPATSV